MTYGQSGSLTFPDARPGDNTLAILVKASPRSKVLFYDLDGMRTARGLWGGVSTDAASTPVDVSWKKWDKATKGADAAALAKPDYDDSTWTAVDPSALALTTPRGDSWYRGTFNVTPAQVDSMLETPQFAPPPPVKGQREPQPPKVIVYLNGQLLSDHTVDASKLLVAGKNTVLVLIQSRLGGDTGQLGLALWHNSPLAHATWHFHGGLDDLDETAIIGRVTNWDDFLAHRPWQTGASTLANQPTFWKCRFDWHKTPNTLQTVGLDTAGLKAGHVWLNGHNLGESPQDLSHVHARMLDQGRRQRPRRLRHLRQQARPAEAHPLRSLLRDQRPVTHHRSLISSATGRKSVEIDTNIQTNFPPLSNG